MGDGDFKLGPFLTLGSARNASLPCDRFWGGGVCGPSAKVGAEASYRVVDATEDRPAFMMGLAPAAVYQNTVSRIGAFALPARFAVRWTRVEVAAYGGPLFPQGWQAGLQAALIPTDGLKVGVDLGLNSTGREIDYRESGFLPYPEKSYGRLPPPPYPEDVNFATRADDDNRVFDLYLAWEIPI